jgi:hypothetical protein
VLTCIIAVFSACKGQNKETEPMEQTHLFTNELIHETSPYLLQHAHNPVNWYPWGESISKRKENL